jgi:hypothetical protein
MHKMNMYENLRDMLEREVQEIQKEGNLDTQKLDNLYKLMSALKHTNQCIEEESMEGASYDNRGMRYGMSNNYSRMMPYSMDNMSYARRDGDGDGRYNESRDNFRNRSYRGQSYGGSYEYSRDNSKRKMVQKLETLMDDTMSEYDRNAIMDCIDKIK